MFETKTSSLFANYPSNPVADRGNSMMFMNLCQVTQALRVPLPLLLLLGTVLYLTLSALLLGYIEGREEHYYQNQRNGSMEKRFPVPSSGLPAARHGNDSQCDWCFGSAFLFTFSIVTTIGYGHVTPKTTLGQAVTMVLAVIGIPLSYLGMANIGRMFHEWLINTYIACRARRQSSQEHRNKAVAKNGPIGHFDPKASESPPDLRPAVFGSFIAWLALCIVLLPIWEDMSYWEAAYFTFVSLTTIGFGDLYPRNYAVFPVTYVLLTVGLVLTTMMIDLLADYLRKVQYFGRKMKNFGAQYIWIGDQRITVGSLVQNVASQMPISNEDMDSFISNLDQILGNAVDSSVNPRTRPDPLNLSDSPHPVRPECFSSANRGSLDMRFYDDQTTLRSPAVRAMMMRGARGVDRTLVMNGNGTKHAPVHYDYDQC